VSRLREDESNCELNPRICAEYFVVLRDREIEDWLQVQPVEDPVAGGARMPWSVKVRTKEGAVAGNLDQLSLAYATPMSGAS
jgi:hypothetical protein